MMPVREEDTIARILHDLSEGSPDALDRLIPLIYEELRRIAHGELRNERPGHTLSTTALVHEAYLKLVNLREVEWQHRAHFFAVSARLMRQILVDYARTRGRDKRGGHTVRVSLSEAVDVAVPTAADLADLIDLDEALTRLAAENERLCRVVECRCLAGLSVQETAQVLGISPATVKRDWSDARAALNRELGSARNPDKHRDRLDSLTDQIRGVTAGAVASADVSARLLAGLKGHYRVEREIGRGGMAIVFLVEDLKHGRHVALKVLHPSLAASLGAPRFLQEIAIAAHLAHPHILPLYDSGEVDGLLYYVMPYVEGDSLRDRLRRERRLPIIDALTIARDVADALTYAHSRNVVHRDIKPENILFLAGHAVVSDFGIARALTAAAGRELSETGVILGTPAYMSPEQATAHDQVDGRSDVYAMGCVLFEMLTGQTPFSGSNPKEILDRKSRAPAPPIRTLQPMVPEAIERLLDRALQSSPANRLASAQQFAAALSARMSGSGRGSLVDPHAYDLYLKGNVHLEQGTESEFREAIELYQQAIAIDPAYAPAQAAMATAYIELGSWMSSLPPSAVRPQATAAALQAVESDPDLAEGHIALARIRHLFDWDWVDAETEFKRGIELNPRASFASVIYANYLMSVARFEEAAAISERTIARDHQAFMAYVHLGWALESLGRDEEAEVPCRTALRMAPDHFHNGFAELLIKRGKIEEASQLADRLERSLGPDGSPTWLALLSYLYGRVGRRDDAQRLLTALEARAATRYTPPHAIASAYIGLGRHDRALDLLDQAFEVRDVTLVWLKTRTILDPLRHLPRFQEMVRRMNYPA